MKVTDRWPAALGLAAAVILLIFGANSELVAISVGVATLCYLAAAALHRPGAAWAAVLVGSIVITAAKLLDVPWWAGIGIAAALLVAYGIFRRVPVKALTLQSVALLGFGGVAVGALFVAPRTGMILAGLALASHAIWDTVHFRRNAVVPRPLAEACMAFDIPLGLGLVVIALAG